MKEGQGSRGGQDYTSLVVARYLERKRRLYEIEELFKDAAAAQEKATVRLRAFRAWEMLVDQDQPANQPANQPPAVKEKERLVEEK